MNTKKKTGTSADRIPSKSDILEFIDQASGRVSKREIARAFKVRDSDRVELKRRLKEMAEEGLIDRGRRKQVHKPGTLPRVAVVEITGRDVDGELMARPVKWDKETAAPPIIMAPSDSPAGRVPALGVGDRLLARLRPVDGQYEARTIKRLDVTPHEILGVYQVSDGKGRIVPTDRKVKKEYAVDKSDAAGADSGDVVLAEAMPGRGPLGLKRARIKESLGNLEHPRSISLIAIHTHGIPTEFPRDVLQEAEDATPVSLGQRTDLRHLPLITIDPEDARDHDDAVWAAPDDDPKNPDGWQIVVAIADVAHYVRPGSALDETARSRGNSAYFPDRVVPMLPEALSANLCSLMPGEDRPCLAVRMWLDAEGNVRRHKFVRGLMRSHAALDYRQVQRARDGHPDREAARLQNEVITPLYGAFDALMRERARRNPLDIDVPERRIDLAENGSVLGVNLQERFDSHRLVEEFMIRANVAAAEALERRSLPCMYRVHEPPAPDKLEALREFLATLDYSLPKAQTVKPRQINAILRKADGTAHDHLVNEVVLRSQSQAYYSPDNLGHFGLGLERYAHFTSPIRRYADLLVHRALIRRLNYEDGALTDSEAGEFSAIGEEISRTERRAMAAEREASDRYLAVFLTDRIGAEFQGRISGVTRFGLFVTLSETGADGLIPIQSMSQDFFDHDEKQHALIGRKTREIHRLGDRVIVTLFDADPITGGVRLHLVDNLDAKVQPKSAQASDRPKPARKQPGRKQPGPKQPKAAAKGKTATKTRKTTGKAAKKKSGKRKPQQSRPS